MLEKLLLVAEFDGRRFEIIQDTIGFFVWAYIGQGPRTTHDYLQNDLEMAIRCAQNEFGVPTRSWRRAMPDEKPAYAIG